jgi:branched-chain amino acid transport system permease protein
LLLAATVSTLVAGVIGVIAFRLRGPYFTLATIAFGEVLRLIATNLDVTGGAIGLTMPGLFHGRTFWRQFYLASVALTVIAFVANYWVSRSRFGYYLMAIREDEDTASAVGINTARCKLWSLLLSAFLTALAGALYASAFQFIVPDSVLTLEISVQIAIITMLGGAGTLLGPIVGAALLLSAQEVFKNQFRESHLLIYGILIVVVVLFLPEGIVGGLERLFRRRPKVPAAKPQTALGGTAP